MVTTHARRRAVLLTAALIGLTIFVLPSGAVADSATVSDSFERRGPEEISPSGNSVYADCQLGEDQALDGWLNATADLNITQANGSSRVAVRLRDARPHTYYTVWLRLGGTDSNGDAFGGNPLTGGKATPLANTQALPALLATTGPGNGSDSQANGFRTNAAGNATYRTNLDFPIVAGAYPFQRFPGWDPSDERLPAENPAIYPVAIAGPQGPYTLRIVSHCTDEIGHGLTSGAREWWFDWTVAN